MPSQFLAVLGAVVLVNLLCSALILWLSCKILRVRRQAAGSPGAEEGVGFRRALALTLLIGLVNLLIAGGVLFSVQGANAEGTPAFLGAAALQLFLPLLILRLGLPAGWLRSLGVYLVGGVFNVLLVVGFVVAIKLLLCEAFVIPTGSMAETVLGYHKDVVCPECGLRFAVNASLEAAPSDGPAMHVHGCTCPNCRQMIRMGQRVSEPLGVRAIPDPGVTGGDRVVVGKGFFGFPSLQPERLDLVVFDFPHSPPGQPIQRYIERLIGLPGETIAIHRGKLFLLPASSRPKPAEQSKEEGEPSIRQDEEGKKLFRDGKFEPIRKKPEHVLALMRLVYDNDHQAKDLDQKDQRWLPAEKSGWSASGKTAFQHDGSDAGELTWLRYRHVLRGEAPKPQLITDFLGYNTYEGAHHGTPQENWASDLIVECEAEVDKPQGVFALELSRGPDRFQARFDLAEGTCTLFRMVKGKEPEKLDGKPTTMKDKGAHQVRFANSDDRLAVWIDERLVFGDGVPFEMSKELAPVKENDLDRPVSVGSQGAGVVVSKLKVFRDAYYTTNRNRRPDSADVEEFKADDPETFKHVAEAPVSCYYVRSGHYFCLGDNSPESSDSRSWGLVGQEKMLGKVFARYFPLSRACLIR